MNKIRLSLVSYINTLPFIHSIKTSDTLSEKLELVLDYPAKCAEKILSGEVDGGLLPVGAIPRTMESDILTNYCIGAKGFVRTVCLFSHSEIDQVETIYLDYQSRTSVRLCQLIVQKYWKRDIKFVNAQRGFETQIKENEGVVIIGDRVFEYEHLFQHQVDLSAVWKEWTGLDFAFAVWVGNPRVKSIENELNEAFAKGLAQIPNLYQKNTLLDKANFIDYLTNNISYPFDNKKKEGMRLFRTMIGNEKDNCNFMYDFYPAKSNRTFDSLKLLSIFANNKR